jgi:hypothetical protein
MTETPFARLRAAIKKREEDARQRSIGILGSASLEELRRFAGYIQACMDLTKFADEIAKGDEPQSTTKDEV